MIISRTPFRISFFGGGTDFPDFFTEHGGATLCTTINKYCYLSVHRLGQFFKHRYRASYAKTELVQEPAEFEHPLIRECLLHLDIDEGLEIAHTSDLPGRTGLGTSSSFTVGLLNALYAFQNKQKDARELAELAITIERERVGDPGGYQDQYAAAFGGLLRLDFSGNCNTQVRPVELAPERSAELLNHLLVFYTGIERSAKDLMSNQTRDIHKNTDKLLAILRMVNEAENILCSNQDINAFGDLLHEAWRTKQGLAHGITNEFIDRAYEGARNAGARGGKLLGAGGRGFLLLFAEPAEHSAIRTALTDLREVSFEFSSKGSSIIFHDGE